MIYWQSWSLVERELERRKNMNSTPIVVLFSHVCHSEQYFVLTLSDYSDWLEEGMELCQVFLQVNINIVSHEATSQLTHEDISSFKPFLLSVAYRPHSHAFNFLIGLIRDRVYFSSLPLNDFAPCVSWKSSYFSSLKARLLGETFT